MDMQLVWPSKEYLVGYRGALERGWSANTTRNTASEELAHSDRDPEGFLNNLVDREASGPPIIQSDGSARPRIPGYRKWMWDGEFCGSIGLRWVFGMNTLPLHVLGHIGYSVVPWKRRLGYATRALGLLLPEARAEGLVYVDITTDVDNLPSQRVILANGGRLIEEFVPVAEPDGRPILRFRITLPP